MDTNPDYNKIPFGFCLNKYQKQYRIPEIAFNNLMNSLPYTFSALSEEEKKRYLDLLNKFIKNETSTNDDDNSDLKEDIDDEYKIKSKKSNKILTNTNIIIFLVIIIALFCLIFLPDLLYFF